MYVVGLKSHASRVPTGLLYIDDQATISIEIGGNELAGDDVDVGSLFASSGSTVREMQRQSCSESNVWL